MSLEIFIQKLDELVASGVLDAETKEGLVLRIEISADGIQVEGVRPEEFCPRDVWAGRG
jgi:hypothetical protein